MRLLNYSNPNQFISKKVLLGRLESSDQYKAENEQGPDKSKFIKIEK